MSFSSVPVVDFSKFWDPSTKPAELEKLKDAIFNVGFLYLTNTGRESIVDEIYDLLPRLFALPDELKEACSMRNSPAFLGYTQLGAETTAKRVDMREQFDFGTPVLREWTPNDPIYKRLEGQSQYPSVPGVKPIIEKYLNEMQNLSRIFLAFVAECLSLPRETFHKFSRGMDRLKLVKYPPSAPGSLGVGPHKDSTGLFTFLSQDSVGGLQVLNKDGKWIDAPPIPGSFIINIQQGFEAITGGICGATIHRVLAPKEVTRYSIPFFLGVDLELTLDQLKRSAAKIVARIPTGHSKREKGEDVISEFLSPEFACFGEAQLRNRIVSHKDVGARWYPELYKKYVDRDI